MTVYRYTASIPRHIHLDQPANVTQCILIVEASSQSAAVSAFTATGIDCTPYLLKTYGSTTGMREDVETAQREPGAVWAHPLNHHGREYVRVLPLAEYLAATRYTDMPGRPDMAACLDCAPSGTVVVNRDDQPKHNAWHRDQEAAKHAAARRETAPSDHGIRAVPTAARYEVRPLDVFGAPRWIVWDRLHGRPMTGTMVKAGELFGDEAEPARLVAELNGKPENRFPWPPAGT